MTTLIRELWVPFKSRFVEAVTGLGGFLLFGIESLGAVRHGWRRRELILRQCEFVGVKSVVVITIAGFFMGAVLGYQLYASLHLFGAEALLGGSVGVALYRELAPVLAAVLVTGNAGAAMAAELASMRITEQIDALEVMAIDPVEYLVMPRLLAGVSMLPLIAVYFAVVATFASALIACGVMGLDRAIYWSHYAKVVDTLELVHCTVKASVFGLMLAWIACYFGFHAYGGARAVGSATRTTVVVTFLVVLLMDYVLTSLLPFTNVYFTVS